MQKNVIIHFGLEKCASTLFQKYIFPKIEEVHYAGRDSSDSMIELLRRIIRTNPICFNYESEKKWLKDYYTNIDAENLLISHEYLAGNRRTNSLDGKTNLDSLKALFPNAKMVLFFRRQDNLLESYYRQIIKEGYSVRINDFLNFNGNKFAMRNPKQQVGLDVNDLNYYSLVKYTQKLFGKENVVALPFELFKEDKQKFFSILYESLNIPPYVPSHIKKTNPAISSFGTKIMRLFNRFLINPYNTLGFIPEKPFHQSYLRKKEKQNRLWKTLSKISKRCTIYYICKKIDSIYYIDKPIINKKVRELIHDIHKEDNKKLSELIGIPLKPYGYY